LVGKLASSKKANVAWKRREKGRGGEKEKEGPGLRGGGGFGMVESFRQGYGHKSRGEREPKVKKGEW